MQEVNIYYRLEVLQGPRTKFRGMQEPAINTIMIGQSLVVIITGTGTGKTMAIMLPASSISGSITIMIMPLCVLQGNLQERCEKA
jgi:superfamily II DNA helicase RecQ